MRLAIAFVVALFAVLPARADVNIQEVTSPGGIKAWLVEEHSLPFIALEIAFRGGTSLDQEGKRGAVNLMSGLLEEGAGELDSRAYSRAREALATSIGFSASSEELSVSARFLTEKTDESVELIRVALQDPRFSPEDVERVRAQVLSGLAFDAKDPSEIAGRSFATTVWGDHPYATSGDGTPESVAALTRDDLVAAHRNVLVRDNVIVGAVGDITPEQLGTILDAILGGLPQSGAAMPPKVEPEIPAGVKLVDFPTPQSVVMMAQRGIGIDHPDYFAAVLLNQILGGGSFESRLMDEVREKRGLTYGVYTYLQPRDFGNIYVGSLSSSNDKVAEAISVIRDEWQRAHDTGVTKKELQDAKTYLTGAYPLRFDGNSTIASILVGMQMIGLGPDYPNTRNEKVEAVTMDDVQRVAKELLDPESLLFLVVGQPEGLDATVE